MASTLGTRHLFCLIVYCLMFRSLISGGLGCKHASKTSWTMLRQSRQNSPQKAGHYRNLLLKHFWNDLCRLAEIFRSVTYTNRWTRFTSGSNHYIGKARMI